MDFTTLKSLTIPEGTVKKIESDRITLWEEPVNYTNQVPISIDTDGSIYNNIGYKEGYRVRSGGTEAEGSSYVCTGYIPLTIGDTLRIYPCFTECNVSNAINFFDESFNNLGQINDDGISYGICVGYADLYKATLIDDISTLTLTDSHDSAIAYIRITHNLDNIKSGSNLIVTVNEEIS